MMMVIYIENKYNIMKHLLIALAFLLFLSLLPTVYAEDYSRQYVTWVSTNVSQASVGDTVFYRVWIYNNDSSYTNVTVGLSEGKWVATDGIPYTSSQPSNGTWGSCWCNKACYNDGLGDWVNINIPPYDTDYIERTMFVADCMVDFIGEKFDLAVGLYNATGVLVEGSGDTYLITKSYWKDKVEILTTPAPPTTTTTTIPPTTTTVPPVGVNASIVSYTATDINPTLDQEVTVTIAIKNTGGSSYDFAVGLSIGNNTFYCNRNCYTDGLGDYVFTGTLAPEETTWVSRKFKFHSWLFEYNQFYNMKIGVYPATYLPPSSAYDYVTANNYFYTKTTTEKLDAYAISAIATPYWVNQGGQVSIRTYITNEGTTTWNFTLGMSIGLWSATHKTKYTTQQATLLPPCNIECYTDCDVYDEKAVSLCLSPQWFFRHIPPDYTVPFERRFRIPDYFLTNQTFDVAVATWTAPPEEGGSLVYVVYFKNISAVSTRKSSALVYGEASKRFLQMFGTYLYTAFGWDMSMTKAFIWFSGMIGVIVLEAYALRSANIGMSMPVLTTSLILLVLGTLVGWIPVWIGLVLVVITGLMTARTLGVQFVGGR